MKTNAQKQQDRRDYLRSQGLEPATVWRPAGTAREFVKTYCMSRQLPDRRKMDGEPASPKKYYIFNGNRMSISEIAQEIGKSYYFVYARLADINPECDATICVTETRKRGPKKSP